jgi:hypothetical protein
MRFRPFCESECFFVFVPKHPGKTSGNANSKVDNGLRQHKKRLRQPHNTAERQRQKAIGRGEFIMQMGNHHDTSFEQHQVC